MGLFMKRQDLIELFQLVRMYGQSYPCSRDPGLLLLLSDIRQTYASQFKGPPIDVAHNPRGAGRKTVYTDEDNNKILRLKANGLSLRSIAKEAGCSLGHVQSVLRNHDGTYFN